MNHRQTTDTPSSPTGRIAAFTALAMAHGFTASAASSEPGSKADASSSDDPVPLPEYLVSEQKPGLVSSPKFSTPIRDIPQTVQVITSNLIEEQGATSLRDVLRNTPGITFQAGEGGGGLPGDKFTMRGFSAENDILIDGVRDIGAYTRDSFNLERVEVVKGPSSAVAGRGSTGGSINLVTKSPQSTAFLRGSAGLGTEDYKRATIDANQPLAPDGSSALRLNAMWTESGVAGRDVVENSGWAVAPSLAFGIGKTTRWDVSYLHLEQDNVPDYGLPSAALTDPEIDWSNFYGLRDYDYEKVENDIATARVAHRLDNDFTLRGVVRYGRTYRDSAITAPRPPNRQLQQRTMVNDALALQTSLTGRFDTGSIGHSLATGFEAAQETTKNRNRAQTTNQPQTDLYHPNPADQPLGPMPANTGNPSETEAKTLALYAFDTIRLGERWQLTGGLRVDDFKVDYTATNLATDEVTRVDGDDTLLTWRAGVVFNPRANGSVYLGYSTAASPSADGGNTGTGLSDSPTAVNNPNLDPERSYNLELGTKWDLADNRLGLSAALFRTEKTNARTRNANDEPYVLAGKQRVDGVELGLTGNITSEWSATAAVSLMDSEIVESADDTEQGNELARTPKKTFSAWTTYAVTDRLSLGAGAQYMDSVFRSTTNLTQTVPSYWLFDFMASCVVNQSLTLRLNVDNLADKLYIDRIGGGHQIPGPGRSASLTANLRF